MDISLSCLVFTTQIYCKFLKAENAIYSRSEWPNEFTCNKLLSVQYSTVNYKHNVIQQISKTFSSCITETLQPLNSNSPFPLAPSNHYSFCFYEFDNLDTLYKWNHAAFVPFRTGLFHLAKVLKVHPCFCMKELLFFKRLSNIPLYVYTTHSLSIHPLMDSQIAFHTLAIVNNTSMNIEVQISL